MGRLRWIILIEFQIKKLNFKFDNIEISMTKNWKNWKNKVLEIQKSTELDSLVY